MCFSWIYGKQIIALSSIEGWSSKLAGERIDDRRSDMIYSAKTPQDVLDKVNELLKNKKKEKSYSFSDQF